MRNCTVIDVIPGLATPSPDYKPHGKYVFWSNESSNAEYVDFVFNCADSLFLQEAEVNLYFDSEGWSFMKDYLSASGIFRLKSDRVAQLLNTGSIDDVKFPAQTKFPVYFGFSFYSDRVQQSASYQFDFFQRFHESGSYIGGEHFTVNRHPRTGFKADAGSDREIMAGDSLVVSADMIAENALYNWYSSSGDLIYSGKDLGLSPEITEKYQLEVIAISDGAKSYDEVTILVKNNFLIQIIPNPVAINTSVKYSVSKEVTSAYLMIINQTGTEIHNFILNPVEKQIDLNLELLSAGTHTIVLVCDGTAVDGKLLIK